jgi:hypothetical protein
VIKAQVDRLNILVKKFPKIKVLAGILSKNEINWAVAAGSAYFIYTGCKNKVYEVDVWIAEDDKEKVMNILEIDWKNDSSGRHKAKNIDYFGIDMFTVCKKLKNGQVILDYFWTDSVTNNIRTTVIDGIKYFVAPPEDVALLKIANSRGVKEEKQVLRLLESADKRYLMKRKKECGYIEKR